MTNKVFSILKEYGLLAGDKKVIDFLSQLDEDEIRKILLKVKKKNVMVIKLEHVKMFKETTEITIEKKENKISISKKNTTSILQFIQIKEESKEIKETKKEEEVEIIHTTKKPEEAKKWTVQDFVNFYKNKLDFYKRLLKGRLNPISIRNVLNLKENTEVSIIGRVFEIVKRDNYASLVLEDTTGRVIVKLFPDTPAWEKLKMMVPDDIVGVQGIVGKNASIIAKDIIYPDIPTKQIKRANDDVYALFITDIHVGSKYFLENHFKKFLDWLNLKKGDIEIAKKVKYLIITGDLVDGVGIYPEQEKELVITDIEEQYEYFAKLLTEYLNGDDIKVILIPGNHDAVRLEEPQPPIPRDIAKSLYREGFYLLLYHGYAFDWIISNTEAVMDGYLHPEKVMQLLLVKRQLFSGHGSSPYVPQLPDPFLIDIVPDIFVTGHIHRVGLGEYKGTILLNAGCWQETTPFQKKVGHVPDPGKAIAINLKTRDKTILKFYEN